MTAPDPPPDPPPDPELDPALEPAHGPALDPSLGAIIAEISATSLPPVDVWRPERSGEIDIRIARNGDWYHQGARIVRERMVKLFSTVLRIDDEGAWLVTPVEKLKITVEDAPFVAVLVERHGWPSAPAFVFTTNVGDRVVADAEHPVTVRYNRPGGEPSPYVLVRGRLQALISRSAFIELAAHAEERDGVLGVVSRGTFMPLDEVAG